MFGKSMGKLHLKKLNINALRNNVAGNHSIYLSVVLFIEKKKTSLFTLFADNTVVCCMIE